MDTDALIAQLIVDEGLRLKPYADTVGKTTIGIGRNLTDRGISESEARALCANDIELVCSALDMNEPWWRQMTGDRQLVLANMCFNLGWPRLSQFAHMLDAMKAGDYKRAADEMLNSEWARQVGARAQRLAARMRGADA